MKKKPTFLIFCLLAFLGAGIVAYSNSLSSGFLIDDHAFFDEKMKNIRYLPYQFLPDKEKMLGIEEGRTDSYYRPFAHILPMLCHLTFKDNVVGYHVVNLLLLCLAVFLLCRFVLLVFNIRTLAVLTGLMYLVHPINGIFVNYITANVFAAQMIFMILSLSCLWNHQKKNPQKSFSAASVIFYVLALLCHETAMAMPFYVFSLLFFAGKQKFKSAMIKTLPFIGITVIYFLFRLNFASLGDSIFGKIALFEMNLWEYLATFSKVTIWYLTKLVYPRGIVLIWATPVVREGIFGWIAAGFGVAALALWTVWRFRKSPPVLLGLSWFCTGLLPFGLATMFRPSHGFMVEPHWFVFPVAGAFLVIAVIMTELSQKIRRPIAWALVIIVLTSWTFTSRMYNKIWSNERVYCHYWLKETPLFSAPMFYLAKAYEINRQYDAARYYYGRALESEHQPRIILTNLGLMDLMEHKWDDAKKHLLTALRYSPNSAVILSNLGVLTFKDQQYSQAQEYFERAIKLNRYAVLPRLNLAKTYEKQGLTAEAVKTYKDILEIVPHHEKSLVNLIQIYIEKKDQENIIQIARELINHSQNPESLTNAGILLAHYGYKQESLKALQKVKKIAPTYNTPF